MYSIVETPAGKLRGSIEIDAVAFKGVRYAAPPFGANRMHLHRRLARGRVFVTRSRSARSHHR